MELDDCCCVYRNSFIEILLRKEGEDCKAMSHFNSNIVSKVSHKKQNLLSQSRRETRRMFLCEPFPLEKHRNFLSILFSLQRRVFNVDKKKSLNFSRYLVRPFPFAVEASVRCS